MGIIESKKEIINSLRTRVNHIFVLIVTIGAGVTKLFIDKNIFVWFLIGLFVTMILIIVYAILTTSELKEIGELEKEKE